MPIDRAKMKLRITTDGDAAPLREALGGLGVTSFEAVGGAQGGGGGGSGEVLDFLVDPGIYRDVEEAVRTVAGCVRPACCFVKKMGSLSLFFRFPSPCLVVQDCENDFAWSPRAAAGGGRGILA